MKRNGKHIILTCLFLLLMFFTDAQLMGIKTFAITDDESSPEIFTVKQHSAGYFLVGAANGVYRFDGAAFTACNFKDTPVNKAVTAIYEDVHYQVWLGFQSGEIGMINKGVVTLLYAEEGHPKVPINCILEDQDGTIYFATSGEGIYYYKHKRFYNINTDDGLSDNYVYNMVLLKTGLLAGTDKGINTIRVEDRKKFVQTYTYVNGLPDNIVRCLYPLGLNGVQNNNYFFGMQDKGVGVYKGNLRTVSYTKNWSFGQVNSMISQNDRVWVATEDKGIIVVDSLQAAFNHFSVFSSTTGYNKAANLINDPEGNTWFSSNRLLVKTSGNQLQNILPYPRELFTQIHTILCDTKGHIWVNYDSGLLEFIPEKNGWVTKKHVLTSINTFTDVTSLFQDKFGHIWIGTMGAGIIILDVVSGQSRAITEDPLLKHGSILSINGRNDHVWISSLAGSASCMLTDINKDIRTRHVFENFSNMSGIGSNYVYSILVDSKNRVWFGTDGKGITLADHGKFTNYNERNGLKSKVIYSICEDRQGNIWFSTLNGGVYKFDGKRFSNFSIAQGLNDATITAMAIDKRGNVIAVSKKGINVIEPGTGSIWYLDADNGIEGLNEDLNCIATTPAGRLLFSSASGIVEYNPTYTSLQPRIVIQNVQLFGSIIDTSARTSFSYDENNLTFNFTGISFSHASKIRYQYQLSGFSNEWIYTKDNKVNFPRLPSGSYIFKVRCSINGSFKNNNEAAFIFSIKKPFWLQWWFLVLMVIFATSVLYVYIKTREKRLQRWSRLEKEQIQSQFETLKSQVNPHFLFNSFNTLISVIEENPGSAVEYVEHLSDLYRKIVTYRDKDVITLKEEMELIDDYFFIQKKRFGNHLILVNKLADNNLAHGMIPPLTLQLLAENAIKHNAISSETPLVVEIYTEGKYLVVKNNRNPKMTIEKGTGIGLQNIRKRYHLISTGEVRIDETHQYFCVKLPLLKS